MTRHTYLVTWAIDVDATDHRDAACQAWRAMRNPNSIATVFEVRRHDDDGPARVVDLMQETETCVP